MLLDFCIVCATSITSGLTPIYFELTNEVCYPASESLCTLSLFSGNQLASSLFYSTLSVVYSLTDGTMEPHRHHWSATCLFWTPLTSVIISLLPFAFFRAQFNRFHLDSTQKARKQQSVELDDTIEIESAILLNWNYPQVNCNHFALNRALDEYSEVQCSFPEFISHESDL